MAYTPRPRQESPQDKAEPKQREEIQQRIDKALAGDPPRRKRQWLCVPTLGNAELSDQLFGLTHPVSDDEDTSILWVRHWAENGASVGVEA